MSREQCGDLPVFTDGNYCISCWKPSPEELKEINRTGRVWLWLFSGGTQPPVAVDGKGPWPGRTEPFDG